MNNNHGWGLRSELLICLILTLAFGMTVILIGKVVNYIKEGLFIDNNTTYLVYTGDMRLNSFDYSSLENRVVDAAADYYNDYYQGYKSENRLTITVVRLKHAGVLESLKVNNIECSGYVEIRKVIGNIEYNPYIKCDNLYKTEGYQKSYDNINL